MSNQKQLDLVVSVEEKGKDAAFLVSQQSDGDAKHWLTLDTHATSTNYYGVNITDKVKNDVKATAGITQAYFYADGVIYSTSAGAMFGYCEKTGDVPLKHVFQASSGDCTSGGDLIYGDNWKSLDKTKILKLFEGDVVVTAYRGVGDKTKDKLIKIVGNKSYLSVGKSTNKIPARTDGAQSDKVQCESSGGSLSWILCPIINGALDAASAIFTGFIEPYLQVKPIDINGGSQVNGPVIVAWRAFRTIASKKTHPLS